MRFKRCSGVLLHPTSLPGPDGIGDLGPEAYSWVRALHYTDCSLWQVLPLGPTGYGDSPYQCFSAFAGNPYLINPSMLIEDGLLSRDDLSDRPHFPIDRVSYGDTINWKLTVLDRAYKQGLNNSSNDELKTAFSIFCENEHEWLEDYALFMAIKEVHQGASWNEWDTPLRIHDDRAIQTFKNEYKDAVIKHKFRQFVFFRQWYQLKKFTNDRGIQIVGDVPIFISHDSAEAWANSELFHMDKERNLTVVAGVPPDYFSPTGQLWGNPLYRWDRHKETGYTWWIRRLRNAFKLYDIVRLDHFRGFAAYWEVPAGSKTAEYGKWVQGPGENFFNTILDALGELPIIAEDLGEITPDVYTLRDQFQFPGMKILQFAFGDTPQNPFLPHNYPENCVAYTGTHDNNTALGWFFDDATPEVRSFFRRYSGNTDNNIAEKMIRKIWSSVASVAIAPLQDFLNLGSEARMNFPGRASGNWTWRIPLGAIKKDLLEKIKDFNFLYSRSAGENLHEITKNSP